MSTHDSKLPRHCPSMPGPAGAYDSQTVSCGREKERECGTHCLQMHQVPLVTCILLWGNWACTYYLSLFSLLTHRSLRTRLRYYHSLVEERPWAKHLTSLGWGVSALSSELRKSVLTCVMFYTVPSKATNNNVWQSQVLITHNTLNGNMSLCALCR